METELTTYEKELIEEWRQTGLARGAEFAEQCHDASAAFEAEKNARQYADFCNNIAYELNTMEPYWLGDACWDAFEEGIGQGISRGS